MADSSVQRFECPICLCSFDYVVPKLLPCVHTVCEQCLNRLINEGRGKKFKCPNCREEIKVPKDGTKGFRTNIYLVADNDKSREKKVCSFCAEEGTAFTRQPCGHELCNACTLQKTTVSSQTLNACPVCSNNVPLPNYNAPPPPVSTQSSSQRPHALLWQGQVGQFTAPPMGYPVLPNHGPGNRNYPPPLPYRQMTSPITSSETTPVSPSAPPIYSDEGYDTMRNVPDPLQGEEWYVGEISRDQSTEILQSRETDGLFHVRKTIKDDPFHKYTMDIYFGRAEYHLKIKQRPDGRYYVKNDAVTAKHFDDVRTLISYFRREPFILKDRHTGRDFSLTLKI